MRLIRSIFRCIFAVINIGRVENGQMIKGVVKQCIGWIDALFLEEKYYAGCYVIYQVVK